mmetsp:Transcript_146257/g.257809  ORF Transcript_146257/g.257809 Transcript_146257/m.257809 type:complete len:82 (-) Transcript_146257:76-321(-)
MVEQVDFLNEKQSWKSLVLLFLAGLASIFAAHAISIRFGAVGAMIVAVPVVLGMVWAFSRSVREFLDDARSMGLIGKRDQD